MESRSSGFLEHHRCLDTAIELFLDYSRSRNLSPHTMRMYCDRLRLFRDYCWTELGVMDASAVNVHDVRAFIVQGIKLGRSPKTLNTTLTCVRTLYGFLVEEGVVSENPAQRIARLRMPRRIVQTLDADQVRAILSCCDRSAFTGLRNYAIVLSLLDTGMRVSELLNLTLDDIDWRDGLVRVQGKGGKEREVPFGAAMRRTLQDYLARRGRIEGQELVFVNQYGDRLDRCSVGAAIRSLGRQAQLSGVRVSPHVFRHTFAKNWVINGGDPFSLQRILGHTTQQMVSHYVSLATGDLRRQHARFSPADRMADEVIVRRRGARLR